MNGIATKVQMGPTLDGVKNEEWLAKNKFESYLGRQSQIIVKENFGGGTTTLNGVELYKGPDNPLGRANYMAFYQSSSGRTLSKEFYDICADQIIIPSLGLGKKNSLN